MQVRITLNTVYDESDQDLNRLFLIVLIEHLDEILFRTPDYIIRGRRRLSITFYGLSEKEAERILETGRAEIIPSGIVKRAIKINSSKEEELGAFLFVQPEYKEGVKEKLEENRGYRLDPASFMSEIVLITIRTMAKGRYQEYEGLTAPLSTLALYLYEAMQELTGEPESPEDLERYISRKIANEPMYRERSRKARRPRNRSRRGPSSEYSDKNNSD